MTSNTDIHTITTGMCGARPTIRYGGYREVEQDSYAIGTKATYDCDFLYQQYSGHQARTLECGTVDGEAVWVGERARCKEEIALVSFLALTIVFLLLLLVILVLYIRLRFKMHNYRIELAHMKRESTKFSIHDSNHRISQVTSRTDSAYITSSECEDIPIYPAPPVPLPINSSQLQPKSNQSSTGDRHSGAGMSDTVNNNQESQNNIYEDVDEQTAESGKKPQRKETILRRIRTVFQSSKKEHDVPTPVPRKTLSSSKPTSMADTENTYDNNISAATDVSNPTQTTSM